MSNLAVTLGDLDSESFVMNRVLRCTAHVRHGASRETDVFEMDVTERVEAWLGGN